MPAARSFTNLLLFTFLLTAPATAPDSGKLEAAKNVGLAALEEGNLEEARKRFESVRQLAPEELLGWANGAVAAMRSKDLAEAKRFLDQALKRSPNDPRLLALEGVRRELAGQTPGAVEAYERAASANPKDLPSRWAAAKLLSGKIPGGRPRAIRAVEAALEVSPTNLFLLLRLSELLRAEGDQMGTAVHERLSRALADSDARLEKYLTEAKEALSAGDARTASLKYRIVENLLRGSPRYQQARNQVEPWVVGLPLEEWSPALASRVRAAAGKPLAVRFVEKGSSSGLSALTGLAAVEVTGREGRDLVFASERGIVLANNAARAYRPGAPLPASSSRSVAAADFTNSGRHDFATPGVLWTSQATGGYRKIPLPAGENAIPLDFDADGDLDLYISSQTGDRLMRNNLDDSWTDVTASSGIPGGLASRGGEARDFDRDGDSDLVLLQTSGGLLLLDNLRGGRFAEKPANLPRSDEVRAAAAGDWNADGRLDLVWATDEGAFVARNRGDGAFEPPVTLSAGGVPVALDYDNDGFLDLFFAAARGQSSLFRNDGTGTFARANPGVLPAALDAEAVDSDGDGDLDLAIVTAAGGAALLENDGGNANGWIDVVLEGLATGSGKVNRFGYGSEIEAKAQELYVYRTVTRPVTHLGLGARRRAEVLRVVWTNGIPQNALNPPTRTLVKEVQQLKGSCPFVYAYDGSRWHFITDALGRSPLGLLYDGVYQAPADTREWLLVSGERLRPSRGRLVLDFTEELWETVYLDLVKLSALDHPAGVEIVPEEKMVPPPFPAKSLHTVSRPLAVRATDGKGHDRTAEVARADSDFAGDFTPTRHQGIVEPHELTLELPQARAARRVMLYLTGWIFYSDTSIRVSLSQRRGGEGKPYGPVLEVPDGRGGWKTAIPAMGYPAGKTKTMAVELSGLLRRGDPRVRIRTNLEIYWDRIVYTVDEAVAPYRLSPVALASARLFYRGFSRMIREAPEGPHVFLHDEVETAPRWADMAGDYTRYGEVAELLGSVDDRYVVMRGGDAVRLEFDAAGLPHLPPGWVRDWLLVSDGWDKDGDKNTVAGQTVEPLPFHGQDDSRYGEPQAFPNEDAHREFRRLYLTRRGGPEEFREAARNSSASSAQ